MKSMEIVVNVKKIMLLKKIIEIFASIKIISLIIILKMKE